MHCGVGCRHGSDLTLLWRRPVAIALIRPLAWERPYATGAALKSKKIKTKSWSSLCGSALVNPTSIYEDVGLIPGLAQWVKNLGLLSVAV